jgi:hypothetical protein
MNQVDREEMRKMIVEAVSAATDGKCACGLSPESQDEMGHLIGRFRDLGKGNLSVGIEEMSKAIQLLSKVRSLGSKVGEKVATWIVVAIVGFFAVLLGMGFFQWIQKGGAG